MLQALLDDRPLGRVDHHRHLGDVRLDRDQVQEARHRRLRVEQRLVHVDVDHLGAVVDLLAGDLHRLVHAVFLDQPGEGARAGDVGPLADVDEERIGPDVERLQARSGASVGSTLGMLARLDVRDRLGDCLDVVGRRAAAAADEVERAFAGELAQHAARLRRLLVVAAKGVGQAGVGVRDDAARRRCATARRCTAAASARRGRS